jgi:hypothetical protein
MLLIVGQIDRSHAASAKLPLNCVAVLQSVLQTVKNVIVGHWVLSAVPKKTVTKIRVRERCG